MYFIHFCDVLCVSAQTFVLHQMVKGANATILLTCTISLALSFLIAYVGCRSLPCCGCYDARTGLVGKTSFRREEALVMSDNKSLLEKNVIQVMRLSGLKMSTYPTKSRIKTLTLPKTVTISSRSSFSPALGLWGPNISVTQQNHLLCLGCKAKLPISFQRY